MLVFTPRGVSGSTNPFYGKPTAGLFDYSSADGRCYSRYMCAQVLVDPADYVHVFSKVAIPGAARVRVDLEGIGEDGYSPISETVWLSSIPTPTTNRYSEITKVHISLSQTYPNFQLESVSNQLVIASTTNATLFESSDGFLTYYGRIFREDVEQLSNEPYTGEGTEDKFWYPCVNLYNYSNYYHYKNIQITSSVALAHIPPWQGDVATVLDADNYDPFVGPKINGYALTYATSRQLMSGQDGAIRLELAPHNFTVIVFKFPLEQLTESDNISLASAKIRVEYEYRANYDDYTSFLFGEQ